MRARAGRTLALLAVGAFLVVGCGNDSGDSAGNQPSSSPPSAESGRPPPVVVEYGNQRLSLSPYSYCWSVEETPGGDGGNCADGTPPDQLPDLGKVGGDITVTFASDGWTFEASTQGRDVRCAQALPATVTQASGRTWRISLAGAPGRYAVHLFGRGPEGNAAASFAVETTTGGPLPAPVASLTTFFERDGVPDAYRFDLTVSYLATTPSRADARLTVTPADGRVSSYTLTPVTNDANGACVTPGTVALGAPAPRGRVVEEIGRPPYGLRVELELDDERYTATASWPEDVETSSSIPLRFNPPLPASK